MRDGSKSNRDTQVQFRMPAELHTELRIALISDHKSMADLFNEAARKYLEERDITVQTHGEEDNYGRIK